MNTRITPLEAPFEEETAEILAAMMPPGAPPIALFRTFAKNLPMAKAMRRWGSYELSRDLSLSMRQREIVQKQKKQKKIKRKREFFLNGLLLVFFLQRTKTFIGKKLKFNFTFFCLFFVKKIIKIILTKIFHTKTKFHFLVCFSLVSLFTIIIK